MYSIRDYGDMITDEVRMKAYVEALRRSLPPNGVVIDIGAGMGVFALIACQMGARHVYAIETNPLVEFTEEMAVANGFSDRITFIRDMSTNFTPPEKADVIVSDLRGQLPLYGEHIRSLVDARKRLLKPGGTLIPLRDHIYGAFINAPKIYHERILSPWAENDYNLDMTAVLPVLLNSNTVERETPVTLIAPAQKWVTLEYGIREDPNVSNTLEWTIETPNTAHFLCMWFDAELIEGIGYSNSPTAPENPAVYGRAMLPLERPIDIEVGDNAQAKISARLIGGNYEITWETKVTSRNASLKAHYQQSYFFSQPLYDIRKASANYQPKLQKRGQVTRYILNCMNEGVALNAIAEHVMQEFPGEYPTVSDALARVASLSRQYSE